MTLKAKDEVILTITGLTSQGHGVGRYENRVVFVPHTAPQDVVKVEIVNVHKSHLFGVVKEIQTPSPHRVENQCPAFPTCGGCTLRHISYEQECEEKKIMIQEHLKRLGGISVALDSFSPSPLVDRYRNKVQYPLDTVSGAVRFGFYESRTHRLVPLKDCLLQPALLSQIAESFSRYATKEKLSTYNERSHRGYLRHLLLRTNAAHEVMVTVVTGKGKEQPILEGILKKLSEEYTQIVSTTVNRNVQRTNVILGEENHLVTGEGILSQQLAGVSLELSPPSFFQVNAEGAELLYGKIKEYARPMPSDILLDLYCGIGSIGLSMAKDVKKLIGVEMIPEAVANAKRNAEINGIINGEFLLGDAGEIAKALAKRGELPTIVVVDPPRKGIDQQVIDAIAEMQPETVVYVSCNSATLGRDLKIFQQEKGYLLEKVSGVDLFPRTPHVESVALLKRNKKTAE